MQFLANFILQYLAESWATPSFLLSLIIYLAIFTAVIYLFDLAAIFQPYYHGIYYIYIKRGKLNQPDLIAGGRNINEKIDNWRTSPSRFLEEQLTVSTFDLDTNMHMNNARYFAHADKARYKVIFQSGLMFKTIDIGMPLVIAGETVRFRKELKLGQRFTIRTRVVGWDLKALFFEQLFVVNKTEVHAIVFVKVQPAPSRKLKEKHPELVDAPLLYLFRKGMNWSTTEEIADTKVPPKDFQLWLDSMNEMYGRVLGPK